MDEDGQQEDDPRNYKIPGSGRAYVPALIVGVIVVVALTAGLVMGHDLNIRRQTNELADESSQGSNILVEKVGQTPQSRTLDLPATIHGYIETSIYAKVPGYMKTIKVDKGDRVRKGQVLAILESPETDQEVANARANYRIAAITDERYQLLVRQQVVPQQSADQTHATMLQDKATLEQNLAMQAYEVIRSPVDGIVTARYVDPGALIPQTTTPATAATPIVAVATLTPLRVYAYIPQSAALFIKDGDPATISVSERPDITYKGSIIRHPEALDNASRTMLAEVDLPNEDSSLYPGMYARMDMKVASQQDGRVVRDDALVFRDGKIYVPVVRDNQLRLVNVTLGYDNGENVVVHGEIKDDDVVALNMGQAVEDGERVHPIESQTP
ncbi:MAG TPA: efflux RND transporter periplasmic adaptor subunit [Candidatus Binataceae bacterium]|nr:efflux RND transporter periplasmic adaptor subunit [Candidatus Binataceae bacterium]